jgi:septal ring factor EnvC (AmiA/AmiB activator)
MDTRLKGLLIVAALVAFAVSALPARAGSIGTLQAKVDQARSEAQTLAAAVQLRGAELAAAAHDANAAAQRQRAVESELARGAARAGRLEAAVTAAHERLLAAQARLRRVQDRLSRRLIAIYKSGTPDMATVLLEADGFSDLLTRAAYLQQINNADQAIVGRIASLRDQVQSALERVQAAKAEAAGEVARLAAARRSIVQVKAAAQARAAHFQQARAAQAAALSTLRSRMAGWTAEVRQLQQAAAQRGADPAQTVNQWFDGFTIPKQIVMCESGGNYNALNPNSGAGGAYQMLPSTYKGLGGQYAGPNVAPKSEQDRLAAKLWNGGAGRGNWAC